MKKLEIDRNVMGRGSVMIHDQTYYRPTFLSGDRDGSAALFLYREISYRRASGHVVDRTLSDVLAFDTEKKMVAAIESSDWIEGVERGNE